MRREVDHVIEQEMSEVAHAVRRAVEAALVAVLREQKARKKKLIAPPTPPSNEVQIANAAVGATKPPPRERHGFRGLPPPARFDLYALPATTLLTEAETASAARLSISTLSSWRRRERDHPLKWVVIAGRRVRYAAGDIREFIASGQRPRPGRPRTKSAAPAPKISQRLARKSEFPKLSNRGGAA